MEESRFGRVIGALVSPEKTFRSIAERPTWVVPLVLLVLLSLAAGWALQQRVDPAELARAQLERIGMDPSPQQLEQMERQIENQPPALQAVQYLVGAIAATGVYLALGALFMVGFRLAGSEIDFVRSFATVVHGLLPLGVAALLNIPLILSRAEVTPDEVLSGGVLASNLRGLAPEESPVLASLLGSVDFFAIWAVVLLILGYRAVARVSTGTAATVVLVFWVLWVLGKAGFVAIFN